MAFWARYIGGFRHVRAREDRPAGRFANSRASVSKTRPEGCVRAAAVSGGLHFACACVQS